MIDSAAVIARLREIDARSGGRREAWRATWAGEREHLDAWARELAAAVVIERDAFANTWYLLPGAREETVLVGSHSDCVPGGGWLDGILGVVAGLGVLGAVANTTPDAPERRTLAVVDWADEEGTRFGRSLLGSAAATGALTAAELDGLRATDGTPAREVVAAYGFDAAALGARAPRLERVVAALELHIEQGPRLAAAGRSVSAVAGCLGVRRRRLTFIGQAGHAGAVGMEDRRDPVRAAARFIEQISARATAERGLATVGFIESEPGLPTAVAATCRLSLDLRHADDGPLTRLEQAARDGAAQAARETHCTVAVEDLHDQPPLRFDADLVRRAQAAAGGGEPLLSGPLHDSAALALAGIPAAMLFVPSIEGVSHQRAEDTPEADLAAGIEALDTLTRELLVAAA